MCWKIEEIEEVVEKKMRARFSKFEREHGETQ